MRPFRVKTKKLHFYWHLATDRSTFLRALRIAILVGVILNLINNPDAILSLSISGLNPGKVLLTFLVPYGVSTYSSILSKGRLKPGSISQLDAILKCKRCKKTNFHVHIGEPVEECPDCKQKTSWKPSRIFSQEGSKNKILKSLALFARHNPQPLFRMNHEFLFYGNMACIHTGIKRRKQVREKWSSNLFYLEKFVRMATVSNKILKISKLRVQPLLLRAIAYSGPGKINRSNIKT